MEQPKKYIKKPVAIEAIQWTGENLGAVKNFMPARFFASGDEGGVAIKTLEGYMKADIGDFIIKGVKGEFYPCKPDIFAATYYTQDEYAAL